MGVLVLDMARTAGIDAHERGDGDFVTHAGRSNHPCHSCVAVHLACTETVLGDSTIHA